MRSPRPSLAILFGIMVVVAVALPRAGEIRERAEHGLGRGMPPREAELARGFVLGEDEGIDAGTAEDFRRAGLSHLLAVSGQNVTLLALLAMPLLGALGIPLRERLVWILALIAVYVPLAGAGPSIQRAGVMGAAGVLATLAGRRSARFHALVLALVVTLAIDPGIAGDVGWQLSFAAVVGILLLAAPLREAVTARVGTGGARRALAEGLAVTVAATLATAPLIAFYFETVSTTTLLANVLAMPAVAPAMWLGMATAAASQIPGLPVEVLNGVDALLLAYIAQVAAWCAAPQWAEVEVRLGIGGLIASYLGIAVAAVACFRLARWWRLTALRRVGPGRVRTSSRYAGTSANSRAGRLIPVVAVASAVLSVVALWPPNGGGADAGAPPDSGLRIEVLDVGQGEAILLQPAGAAPVLVDGGPPGDGIAAKLAAAGVERLGVVFVTHDQSDHAGGVEELLGRVPVARLLYGRLGRGLRAEARSAGTVPLQVARGAELRVGRLRLEVLWPPPELLGDPAAGADPNQLALVLLARWRGFSMLLTADAEAEAVPIDPGAIDVLKVAHHGSEDAGLPALLDGIRPSLALISVGEANPYGHPAPATLAALAAHGVRVLRTDRGSDIVIDVRRHAFEVTRGD